MNRLFLLSLSLSVHSIADVLPRALLAAAIFQGYFNMPLENGFPLSRSVLSLFSFFEHAHTGLAAFVPIRLGISLVLYSLYLSHFHSSTVRALVKCSSSFSGGLFSSLFFFFSFPSRPCFLFLSDSVLSRLVFFFLYRLISLSLRFFIAFPFFFFFFFFRIRTSASSSFFHHSSVSFPVTIATSFALCYLLVLNALGEIGAECAAAKREIRAIIARQHGQIRTHDRDVFYANDSTKCRTMLAAMVLQGAQLA